MNPTDEPGLLNNYAATRSEQAFRALVDRYVGMVYSAALRQLGDRTLAEEVTQNVFVALARKPESLRSGSTLSSWLYQTTLFQARNCIRHELRRQRREEIAVEIGTFSNDGSVWESLVPMLDEAILTLSEVDRRAVLLRYFESKPLREVGQVMGVSEDAAQKRVSKALDRLTQFFRGRGLAVPAMTLATSLVNEATKAAPVGLAATVSQFAIREAALAPLSGLPLLLFKLMTFTKTQTAAVCLLTGAIPLTIGWHSLSEARAEGIALNQRIETARGQIKAANLDFASSALRQLAAAGQAPDSGHRLTAADHSPAYYAWDESSDYVRVPKSLLERIGVPIGFKVGTPGSDLVPLSEELKAVLRLTTEEETRLMNEFTNAKARYHELETRHLEPSNRHVDYRIVAPFGTNAAAVRGRGFQPLIDALLRPDEVDVVPLEVVSFRSIPFAEEREEFWTATMARLETLLGVERLKALFDQAEITIHFMTGERSVPGQDNQITTFTYLLKGPPEPGIYWARANTAIPEPGASANGGVGGGGASPGGRLLDPSEDKDVLEAMKPILVRWRLRMEQWKTQSNGGSL